MNAIRYEKDTQNIVHLIMDNPNASANVMDDTFRASFHSCVEKILAETDLAGIIFRSAKKTFFAGGDLNSLILAKPENSEAFYELVTGMKSDMRSLETLGVPVVAAITGAALGGGWEICLASHHRIAVNNPKIKVGMPEATLGLLPGAGGVVRTVRLLGIQNALPFLAEGKQVNPEKALAKGLIHELADNEEQLLEKAVAWIKANPQSQQPWDVKGYKIPGGTPSHPAMAQLLPIAPAMMRQKTRGCLPAPEAILSAAVEGAQVDFEAALRIESRYFVELVCGQVSKNLIQAFWFQLNEIKAGASRPEGIETKQVKKVGILGAGMMGAGIAYSCAMRGIETVLKDVSDEAAAKGKAYSDALLSKRVARKQIDEEKKASVLGLITATSKAEDLQGCDLIIEAVFEDRALKASVTQEAEAQLEASAVFASNTSTLPITGLSEASARPTNFIGLHFFSPVDKMPLVEIICGEQTSDETLALAYDFVQQIQKTPIVVNDSRGFFTSRVFGTFTSEGIAMLGEGIAAASIENAASLSGFPVGPLAVTDEVSLSLVSKVRNQTIKDLEAEGKSYNNHPSDSVVDQLLEMDRPGKAAGAGFYAYPEGGKKHLWEGLAQKFFKSDAQIPLQDIKDRLLFIQAIETVRCLDEKVLSSVRDANIGSLFGIGYPAWTGGVLQFINQYGLRNFVARAQSLAQDYGERFAPPASLIQAAENDSPYKD